MIKLSGSLVRLIGNPLIRFELSVDFLLSLVALCQQHLPSLYVVHCFVVVRQQVAFYEWAVAHVNALLLTLDKASSLQVSQRQLRLRVLLSLVSLLRSACSLSAALALVPLAEFGTVNNDSRE